VNTYRTVRWPEIPVEHLIQERMAEAARERLAQQLPSADSTPSLSMRPIMRGIRAAAAGPQAMLAKLMRSEATA
jgi:hypothetical protein